MSVCFYASETDISILNDESQKLFLLGGDGGYGNFGDILQLKNSVRHVRLSKRFTIVIVLAANAISDVNFPAWAKDIYGADAVVFTSSSRLVFNSGPALKLVRSIRNLACIHLYGGGFLNNFWGKSQLGIAEALLNSAPQAAYLISGQQITPPFHEEVAKHVRQFRPRLLGVRDEMSLVSLSDAGVEATFSFDDATEALQSLTAQLPLRRGTGLLLHLNSSNYTGTDIGLLNLSGELSILEQNHKSRSGVTLLQAFRDSRHEVLDSRETLKMLDRRSPFADMRLVDLAEVALNPRRLPEPITGEIGYSCSYHVALWLQLSGIPCWLHHGNAFYDQKAGALHITQDLEFFLREPALVDHGTNLERRSTWLRLYKKTLDDIADVDTSAELLCDDALNGPVPLQFKGSSSQSETIVSLREQISEFRKRDELQQRNLARETRLKDELYGRVQGLTSRITAIGNAYREREMRLAAAEERIWIAQNEVERLTALQASIYSSTSWRVTRPLRAISRYVRHGHFDEKGEVGLFRFAQLVGRRLPLPKAVRRSIGRALEGFRR